MLSSLYIYPMIVAASHQTAVGGFTKQQKLEAASRQLPESDATNTLMHCFTSEAGHRITIRASNSDGRKRTCQSRCYYSTNSGLTGLLYASGIVPEGADNIELRTEYFGHMTITISNAGSFTCE